MSCELMFFFFNDTATTEIYTLSLHDALPISDHNWRFLPDANGYFRIRNEHSGKVLGIQDMSTANSAHAVQFADKIGRHTSELQSRQYLVCRLLLEKKKLSK